MAAVSQSLFARDHHLSSILIIARSNRNKRRLIRYRWSVFADYKILSYAVDFSRNIIEHAAIPLKAPLHNIRALRYKEHVLMVRNIRKHEHLFRLQRIPILFGCNRFTSRCSIIAHQTIRFSI